VRFDSTGPHNRARLESHGLLTNEDIDAITAALDTAAPGTLAVLLLHHHLLPFPHDSAAEWLSAVLGWSWASELPSGRRLLSRLRGRCDLVLHGHRHRPGSTSLFADDARPVSVCNAGASVDLGHVRVFTHDGGRLVASPRWMPAGVRARPRREHVGGLVALGAD
jgi:Icc protein